VGAHGRVQPFAGADPRAAPRGRSVGRPVPCPGGGGPGRRRRWLGEWPGLIGWSAEAPAVADRLLLVGRGARPDAPEPASRSEYSEQDYAGAKSGRLTRLRPPSGGCLTQIVRGSGDFRKPFGGREARKGSEGVS